MADLIDTLRSTPQEWIDALGAAEADVAAGRTVDGKVIHEQLRRPLAELEADTALDHPSKP